MPKVSELLRRESGEQEQQRADTKSVFGEITQLVPQRNFNELIINFNSDSLASRITDRVGYPLFYLANLMDLKPTDRVGIHFVPRGNDALRPDSLWITKVPYGKPLKIAFDRDTFSLGKITVGDEMEVTSGTAKSQSFLLQTFEAIKDDLLHKRTEWRDSIRGEREDFAEKLRTLGKSTAVAVDRVLRAFSSAFPQEQFSVFGLIDEPKKDGEETKKKPEDQEQRVRLFTTIPFTEDVARRIYDEIQPMDNYPAEESTYSHRLDRESISFDSLIGIPRAFGINPRKLTIKFGGIFVRLPSLEVTVESLYPARTQPLSGWDVGDNKASYQPKPDPDEILEQHFASFLAGGEPKFYPITAVNQEAVLLSKSPNSTPNGVLFDTKFLNKPEDFGV